MNKLNIHVYHRRRMKKRYEKYGSEAFDAYQLMEMLLFYSYKRRDTNSLAHIIMDDRETSFYGSKTTSFLKDHHGVGDETATLVRLSSDTCLAALTERLRSRPMSSDFSRRAFLWLWFKNKPDKSVALLLLDESMNYIDCLGVYLKRRPVPDVYRSKILTLMAEKEASYAVLCHNHQKNNRDPSVEDMYLTAYLQSSLSPLGYTLLSHLIVTDTDCIDCRYPEAEAPTEALDCEKQEQAHEMNKESKVKEHQCNEKAL
ncbi:MAG: hypothetical protein IJD22_04570 [Clostridia bacterium]|nr:hypothetical protein [Clostridia bacterium]